jgi:hypothetical protein
LSLCFLPVHRQQESNISIRFICAASASAGEGEGEGEGKDKDEDEDRQY